MSKTKYTHSQKRGAAGGKAPATVHTAQRNRAVVLFIIILITIPLSSLPERDAVREGRNRTVRRRAALIVHRVLT